ncbi:MAG: endolytic transglycosylase MltG [Oscillospiraceae bacterium]|nr:endolytic transglycosylase MltG [Oscillospiraceae bacterium]
MSDRFEEQSMVPDEPTRPVQREDAPIDATPQGEPTRPLTDFDRRAWALMGSQEMEERSAVQPEPQPPELPMVEEEFDDFPDEHEERDYMPIRFRRDARLGCLGGLMYAAFVICLSIVLACVAWMAASDVLALNKEFVSAEVTIPDTIFSEKAVDVKDENGEVIGQELVQAADMNVVARLLQDQGIVNYKWLFRLYSAFSNADEKIDPGTYELNTNFDYRALVKKMQVGSDSQVQTKVTFPEGFTLAQIFERLEENKVCSQEELYEAAANADYSYSFLEEMGTGNAGRLEGYLFPDTYYFYEGMQAPSAINKFLSNFRNRFTAEMIQRLYDSGMTYHEVVTIASIIEKEAANDDERYLISSVIQNRLAQGMLLQMDATVLYGAGETELAMPTGTMLRDAENLYNTYVYEGLPPGPISNPGLASLRAALYPGDTEYLFYALDEETGTHKFFIFQNEFEAFLQTQSYYETPDE